MLSEPNNDNLTQSKQTNKQTYENENYEFGIKRDPWLLNTQDATEFG